MTEPVLRTDEQLCLISWPSLQRNPNLHLNKDDVLILCAGFEERSTHFLRQTISLRKGDFKTIIIEYEPTYEENRLGEINQLVADDGLLSTHLVYNRCDPAGMGERIVNELINEDKNIYVDISGMSRLLIVQLLVALKHRSKSYHNISVLYAEADNYSPSQEEVDANISSLEGEDLTWSYISSGVYEVAVTPELSSVAMWGEEIRLIAFPSFSPEQISGLLQEIQPTYLELISGVPPRYENRWREEAIKQCNEVALRGSMNIDWSKCSTLEYSETLKRLLEIYANRQLYDRILMAPTGSKLQSVAVGLARAFLEDIQVVYPTPGQFKEPTDYSLGVREGYLLNLSVFSALVN